MKLHEKPFNFIKNNLKTVEFRLLDQKRKVLKPGVSILFTTNNSNKTILVKITDIRKYENFENLYDSEENLIKKYTKKTKKEWIKGFSTYYSSEKQKQYSPIAIEFMRIALKENFIKK